MSSNDFGFYDNDRISLYHSTGIITGALMSTAVIYATQIEYSRTPIKHSVNHDSLMEIHSKINNIQAQIKKFEKNVWFSGLKKQNDASDVRGFRMDFDDNVALMYTLAGRVQITIQKKDGSRQVSLICGEDSVTPTMGLNSIEATEDHALLLIRECEYAFLTGNRFSKNTKVGI